MDAPPTPVPLVVVGGSAGAIAPLRAILAALDREFDAAICVVVHTPDDSPSALERVLAARSRIEVVFATDGAPLRRSCVYVAPPGRHLLVEDGHLVLAFGPRENGARPAIDPLFRSAAKARSPSLTSVVLSGTLDDGAAGTVAIRAAGGLTIAQDPADAEFRDMPANAIATGAVALVAPAAAIAARLMELAPRTALPRMAGANGDPQHGPGEGLSADTAGAVPPPAIDTVQRGTEARATDLGGPGSPYACPTCGGVLYERGDPASYLCRVGHRFSAGTLGQSQELVVEDAMWTALRTLEEAASLAGRVRDRAETRGDRGMARRFEERRVSAQERADRIRALLDGGIAAPLVLTPFRAAEEPSA